MQTLIRWAKVLAVLATVGVAGCKTPGQFPGELPAQDAKPFTRAELYAYLSEKTEVWNEGAVFYSDAGTLLILWKGDQGKGNWTTKDDGTLCWHVRSWPEPRCQTYYHSENAVNIIYKGAVMPAPPLQQGNTLVSFGFKPALPVNYQPGPARDVIAERFKREETIAFLSGKTVIWGPARGLYYVPDFTLEKIWNGVRGKGRWSVTEEGAVCWHIPGWGVTPCEFYYYRGGTLMAVFNGQHSKAGKHVAGNRIGGF